MSFLSLKAHIDSRPYGTVGTEGNTSVEKIEEISVEKTEEISIDKIEQSNISKENNKTGTRNHMKADC